MKNILIVDDEKEMLESLEKILSYREDFNITSENDPEIALRTLSSEKFDLIITDLKMGDISGIDILKTTKDYNPLSKGIIISGYGTIEASVEAMRIGAFDFIEKPFTSKKLFEAIDGALKDSKIEPLNKEEDEFEGIICRSKVMKHVLSMVKKVAPTEMNLLIQGESGTGKELVARAVHNLSKGNTNPFVPVNCGALPETLFESELFGHEKGAFTGATKTKPGLLEFANGGTFFFDEIGDMTMAMQVKLLRMLEENKIRRIGGQKELEINVRIIAATNRNLEGLVQLGQFRKDLYYRLSNFTIDVPPLRERIDDIMPLANHTLNVLCAKGQNRKRKFSEKAGDVLRSYSWPGNVRELQNIVNRSFILSLGDMINASDIPLSSVKPEKIMDEVVITQPYKHAKESIIEKFEVEYLSHHLRENQGNITKTAEKCGLDRRSIHRLISKYNIIYKN